MLAGFLAIRRMYFWLLSKVNKREMAGCRSWAAARLKELNPTLFFKHEITSGSVCGDSRGGEMGSWRMTVVPSALIKSTLVSLLMDT